MLVTDGKIIGTGKYFYDLTGILISEFVWALSESKRKINEWVPGS